MNSPIFWDVIGPAVLAIFVIIFGWSLYGLKRKSFTILLIGTILNIGIASIFWWSIGRFLVFVPFFQLVATIYILLSNRKHHFEK
ncbi:hypothetical protein [Rummeliibacillus sp. SL167]|uniref:hypothetical protein n=1 Tax=Rummeliibacillus sp. SL167 TaxID=2579792 RepID=UPI0011B67F7B|nr:hypothetical protein [Rummeliibacillus sp. SL167]